MCSLLQNITPAHNQFSLLMLVISSLCWQHSSAYRLGSLTRHTEHLNPNMRCPGKNEESIWRPCKQGGYIENPYPTNCGDRYVCYVALNEPCHHSGDKCADNAICTVCGICQKCDSVENCSDFKLCPNAFNTMNIIKRFLQKSITNTKTKQ